MLFAAFHVVTVPNVMPYFHRILKHQYVWKNDRIYMNGSGLVVWFGIFYNGVLVWQCSVCGCIVACDILLLGSEYRVQFHNITFSFRFIGIQFQINTFNFKWWEFKFSFSMQLFKWSDSNSDIEYSNSLRSGTQPSRHKAPVDVNTGRCG